MAVAGVVLAVVLGWGVRAAEGSGWMPFGSSGGDIAAIAVDPANDQVVYAATYKGGVYKTINGGLSWFAVNGGLNGSSGAYEAYALAIDPLNVNTIYLGTNYGVYKTTDAGARWSLTTDSSTIYQISSLAINPATPNMVYATSRVFGVIESTNGGGSWTTIDTGISGSYGQSIVINPTTPTTLFSIVGSQIYQTTDGGAHWSTDTTGPSDASHLTIDPSAPSTLFATLGYSDSIQRSTDGGATWNGAGTGLPANVRSIAGSGSVWYAGTFSSPTQGGLWKSTDGGATFSESDTGITAFPAFENVLAIAVDPTNASTVFAGTGDVGIFKSLTAGSSWNTASSGMNNVTVSSVAVDPTVPAFSATAPNIWAQVGEFNTIEESVNGGPFTPNNQTGLPFQLNPGTLRIDASAPQDLYVGTPSGLFGSTNGGSSWALVPVVSGSTQPNVTVLSNIDLTTYIEADGGVARYFRGAKLVATESHNGGTVTATQVDPYGTGTVAWVDGNGVPTIVFLYPDGRVADVTTAGLDPTGSITAIAEKPGASGTSFVSQGNKVFRLERSGWVDTGAGSIAAAQALQDPPGSLYVGTHGTGVYLNTNPTAGGTWTAMNSGLGNLDVNALDTFPGSSYLVAGTDGGGVWAFGSLPPRTKFTDPTMLSSPVRVTFSIPVKNVTSNNFALRVTGSTTNLAGTITCQRGSGAVSCASGPVTSAALQPASPLVPGQYYTALINPTGAAPITDTVGDPAIASSGAFRASTSEQETSVAARYAWKTVSDSHADGGSYTVERRAGASASFSFTGTSVSWITVDGPAQGEANVYIDGALKGTFNQYAATPTYGVTHAFSGLSSGTHSITVKVLGVKGSPSATDTQVALDAVQVGSTLYSTPAATYSWQLTPASGASGGQFADSDLNGTNVTFKFRGTAISWYTVLGPNQGKANVYIDGTLKGTVDNYAAATTYGKSRSFTGLSDAVHTLIITPQGTKQAASTGTLVSVDRWVIN